MCDVLLKLPQVIGQRTQQRAAGRVQDMRLRWCCRSLCGSYSVKSQTCAALLAECARTWEAEGRKRLGGRARFC